MKRDTDRKAKQKCAIKIQKVWKGHQQRKDFRIIVENLRVIKKLRKIFEDFYGKDKKDKISEALTALREGKQKVDEENQLLYENFISMCATQIQSTWKGT